MCNKIIHGLLAVLILTACGSGNQFEQNKAVAADNHKTIDLIGQWTICKLIYKVDTNVRISNFTTCPKLNFSDSNAIFITSDNKTEHYSWKTISDTLILKITDGTESPHLSRIKYTMTYTQDKKSLELLSPDKEMTYIFTRQN
jgi:hypothetical protein